MRFPSLRTAACLLPLILGPASRIPAQLPAQTPPALISSKPKGTLLLLHYRWRRDSLALIDSKRIPAAVKASRLSPEKRARGREANGMEPRSPFSYELFDSQGKRISVRYLQDPGLRRVEYREKGQRGLKIQEERVDSADIFLRIPETEAKTIRFFRHAGLNTVSQAAPHAAPHVESPPARNPGLHPAKSLVAEFPLE